ncbi:DJ-1/PfpI family protein [Psychroserpens sp.]|uniref:DJ-1/PfpI family protein n=1 Tax=Psychroserpens sp. TaxID=2020870 RepID=UPI001B1F42DA|nr:DJ-1/PfpI family protein [Psychroserpens sp.]MBO6606323.1 DJ-1/PfpI family protein [Psychroserpens sp.]MBO6632155.1 DJ-1/PfpI family protein [Psychroserpens sp.]MBO6653027.1 DJ-1/PfpI family protein [Psychroserpens sp.]MBO6680946.1 DJ-1/PfpI family protein [Psychroserpens sp.]MBO6750098.1 DJ-1/PfpI family protein [Psychroserpens sp.]
MTQKLTNTKKPFTIVIPIYDGVDYMDIAVPREMFYWLNHDKEFNRTVDIVYVGEQMGTFTTNNSVSIAVEGLFSDPHLQQPNLIWVPGGRPKTLSKILNDKHSAFTAYVKKAGANADWVCSVCEGAVLLANTGLLDGHDITTHWNFVHCFANYPKVNVVPGNPRYIKSGNRVTGGGISSGMDEALFLIELIAGTNSAIKVQQTMQYYPRPPVMSTIPKSTSCPIP